MKRKKAHKMQYDVVFSMISSRDIRDFQEEFSVKFFFPCYSFDSTRELEREYESIKEPRDK